MRLGTSSAESAAAVEQSREAPGLWDLALHHTHIDPQDLTVAIERQVRQRDLDYRSCLLIHDALEALQAYWGPERIRQWLAQSAFRAEIERIWSDKYDDDVGFPSLRARVMDITRPETVRQFFREVGLSLRKPVQIQVGGAIALIMRNMLSRKTEDVDVVDEVPEAIRSQHRLLDELKKSYFLEFGHFQSHYLGTGWQNRLQFLDTFGELRVYLVDPYDVFLSKLFSIRRKDLDDMRKLATQLDKEILTRRLQETTASALAAKSLREPAEKNWHVLFGEKLPA
jgi:hypothetical protein